MSFVVMATIANAITFVLCPLSVALLCYWAFKPSGKPARDYDCDPLNRCATRLYPVDRDGPEHVMRRQQYRTMLKRARNDDEVADAIEWAYWVLRLSDDEVNEILDEARPLADPHDQAALAVRRMYITGFSA